MSCAISKASSSDAAELIAKALTIKPNDAAAYANLAVVFEALGRLDEAIDAADRALLINPDECRGVAQSRQRFA